VLDGVGAFPVHRGLGDVEAVETAVQLAHDGHVVVMFPEGTRREKGLVKKHIPRPRSGAARIALEAGVPLVPCAVTGTDRLSRLGPLRVAYGTPLEIDDLRGSDELRRAAQEATDRLMARIAELEAEL
jgi:1-acyl-sn-glycerol-3-phosphate acyltransferase